MFKEELENHLENPADTELGKKNLEVMEKLVNELKKDGEYIDTQEKKEEEQKEEEVEVKAVKVVKMVKKIKKVVAK